MAKGPSKKCVKVPIEDIRARLGAIDEVKDLPDAILDGLAKAICLTRPHPPELGRLITVAKSALDGLSRWIKDNGDDPALLGFLTKVTDELEARRGRLIVRMKMERSAMRSVYIYCDKDGVFRCSELQKPSKAEPPVFFQSVVPGPVGSRKDLNAMLIFGMGVLMEFLDEDRKRGFEWTAEKDRKKKTNVHASELMAKVLDEFWADDKRIEKSIAGTRMRSSINSQHQRALKKLPSLPKRLEVLKDLQVMHAWLPVPPAQPDDC